MPSTSAPSPVPDEGRRQVSGAHWAEGRARTPQAHLPSLPHIVFQKFKPAQNQENKGIHAHFNGRGLSEPLIHQLLESEFYKQFL